MSAGNFRRAFYQRDNGDIHGGTVQPETALMTIDGTPNDPVAGPVTSDISYKVSKGKDEIGLCPRKVQIRFTGAPPTGYSEFQTYDVVVFDPLLFATAVEGTAISYLGAVAEVVRQIPESAR